MKIEYIYCSERKVPSKTYFKHNSLLKKGACDISDIFVIVDGELQIYRRRFRTFDEKSNFEKYLMELYGLSLSQLYDNTHIKHWRKDIEPYINTYSELINKKEEYIKDQNENI